MGSKTESIGMHEHTFAINLMQHLVVPTFVLDQDCRVLIWNRACERLTGVPASEVVGTRDHWRAFYSEPRLCLADALVQNRMAELDDLYAFHTDPAEQGHGLKAENWCVMPRAGHRLYLAIDVGPIYDEDGKLIAVVETLRDMTEQKNTQLALQQLASCDGLTGIPNRRSFDDKLQMEWSRALRHQGTLSLILADVDQFKRYNDHFGHQGGDECLRAVARILQGQIFRAADMTARYGGEEFAIVLPDTDLAGAQTVAERVRAELESLELPHPDSGVGPWVTLSLGVASCIPEAGTHQRDLVGRADQALYAAKANGRNCVCLEDATPVVA